MLFKTIIGQAAEGEFYFPRPALDEKFWNYIKNGSHVLVSAPRRVGKTSFLLNIANRGNKGYTVKYHVTESINQSNEFFKRLYKSLLIELSAKHTIWEGLSELWKKNKIEKIGKDGIELKEVNLDYFEEFKYLVNKVTLDNKLVFIIDEFAETVENIINDHGESAGQIFLHQNRELRQDNQINKKIQFVYSGSIGLGNIAERIGAIKSINDLADFVIPPFSPKETLALIAKVKEDETLVFNETSQRQLIGKIHWLMPFYVQIILDEIENILMSDEMENNIEVNDTIIDKAISNALNKRNYFEHWHTRLRTTYKGDTYTYAKELLNAASKGDITKSFVFDLAVKFKMEETYTIIVRSLEYDGYITLNEQQQYIFNSPLLKIWWNKNISI